MGTVKPALRAKGMMVPDKCGEKVVEAFAEVRWYRGKPFVFRPYIKINDGDGQRVLFFLAVLQIPKKEQ